jgi:hypothetical protein
MVQPKIEMQKKHKVVIRNILPHFSCIFGPKLGFHSAKGLFSINPNQKSNTYKMFARI